MNKNDIPLIEWSVGEDPCLWTIFFKTSKFYVFHTVTFILGQHRFFPCSCPNCALCALTIIILATGM